MTTNPLPDLSKWHEVPSAATIDTGTQFALSRPDGTFATAQAFEPDGFPPSRRGECEAAGDRYFTADPIPTPRPVPPTEFGTVLLNVTGTDGRVWPLAINDGSSLMEWMCFSESGKTHYQRPDELASWTVANITPGLTVRPSADPLDESDHRDRVSGSRRLYAWSNNAFRYNGCPTTPPRALAELEGLDGPLRFADEVDAS